MAKKLQKYEDEDLSLKLIESENKFKKYCAEVAVQNEEYKTINEKYLKANEELSEKNSTIIRIMNEMRWNEAKSRQMFSSSPVGIMYYDTNMIINELNFAFSEILSAPYHLLKGFDLNTMNDKKVLPSIKDANSGKTGHYEGFYKSTISGKEVYVIFSTHPLYSREDSTIIIGGVLLAQDLTKWKRTQEKLEENEENLRLTLESIGDCVIVTNSNTEIININSITEKILNLKKEDVIGKSVSSIFYIYNTVLQKKLSNQVNTAINENRSIYIQENVEIHATNSTKISASFNISPIRKVNGEVIGAIMVFKDVTEQIKVQNKIIESENKFKSLFENSPTGIALIDINGNIKEVNTIFVSILGSPSAEATKNINVLSFEPLVNLGFAEDFKNCMKTRQNYSKLVYYVTNWKKGIYVQYTLSPISESENIVSGVILNVIDVTAQKEAEEKEKKHLRNIELITKSAIEMLELPLNIDPLHFIGEKLKTIIGDNTVIINKYSVKTQTSSIEHVFCKEERIKDFNVLLDRNLEHLKFDKTPKKVHEYNFTKKLIEINPVDFFVNSCCFPEKESKKIIELHKINKVYFMGICPENELIANIIIITYFNETIENKEVIETFVNQTSLVLQRQIALKNLNEAKEKIEESENRLRNILELSNLSMAIVSFDGTIEFINKHAVKTFGYLHEEIPNMDCWWNLAYPEKNYREKTIEQFMGLVNKAIVEKCEIERREYYPTCKDGTVKTMIIFGVIVDDKIFVMFEDISERKIAEKQIVNALKKAEESDKLKSAFLANMSHELRTPINGIIGFSNLMHKSEINSEKKDNYISQINANSSLLLRLIDDVIDVAKIESGKLTIEKSPCNFTSIMNSLYLHYKQEINALNKNSIELIYSKSNNPNFNIITDHLRLKQVLFNLLSNALKFTKAGKIEFGYSINNNELHCYVKDSGIGIKKENISKIFERFTQLELSISRKFGGTGLGLTISKNIIELLGGKIWVESEWEKGSTFYFTIPVGIVENNINSNETEFSQQIEIDLSNFTILVAEDDDINFMFIEEMLSDSKIKIIRALNGLEAIEIVKTNNKINIVLMDIQMPLMDGYESTKLILEIKPKLPIIAQTAYAIKSEKEKSLKLGCVDYIPKPINLEDLLLKIKKHLPNNM